MATSSNRTLDQLKPGARARVRRVACGRTSAVRLMEMGLVPGTELEIVRRAPLGDPIELRVRGYALSLRATEAAHVDVELIEATK
jgi:ferrous iron transport protein A